MITTPRFRLRMSVGRDGEDGGEREKTDDGGNGIGEPLLHSDGVWSVHGVVVVRSLLI